MGVYKTIIETVTAICTCISSILALYVIIRETVPRMTLSILWDHSTKFQPAVEIQNIGSHPIIISRIDVKYNRIQIIDCMTDPSIESYDNFVVELGEKKRVYFSSDKFLAASSEHDNKPHSLKVTITDYQGRHYTVKRPFTHSDMQLKSFPERFCSLVK